MKKSKRVLSLIVSIAMVISMFTFAIPSQVSAAISNKNDGSQKLYINNLAKLDYEFGVAGCGGKSESDVVHSVKLKDGETASVGGGCYLPNPWSGGSAEGTRVLIAFDVMFTSADAKICVEYHRTYKKADGTVATEGMNNFVHLSPKNGISRNLSNLPVVAEAAPTSFDVCKWYNIAIEVANDGTKEANVYVNGVKYPCQMHDVSIKAYRFRANVVNGSMYIDNYYCNEDAQGVDMYPEEDYVMADIVVNDTEKLSYDEEAKQFKLLSQELTAGEMKAAVTTDYDMVVYKDGNCTEVLEDTDVVTLSSVLMTNDSSKLFRYYGFERENTSVFDYMIDSATECTVTGFEEGYTPVSGNVLEIPATIAGYTVTGIADNAFRVGAVKENEKGLYLPNGLKFSEIKMPDTVKSIGNYAFHDTYAKVNSWPTALEKIGEYAFTHGGSTSGDFSNTKLKEIGGFGFAYVSRFSQLKFPNTLKTIKTNAFIWSSAYAVTLPDSVTSLGTKIFAASEGLKKLRFPRNETYTAIANEVLHTGYTGNNTRYFENMSIYIPETITEIPFSLLEEFKDGKTVTIYGVAGSAAEKFCEDVNAALEKSEYTNGLAIYGTGTEADPYTDYDKDGKGELAAVKFVEYDFENDFAFVVNNDGINTGDASKISVLGGTGTAEADIAVAEAKAAGGGKSADDEAIFYNAVVGSSGRNYLNHYSKSKFVYEFAARTPNREYIGANLGAYSASNYSAYVQNDILRIYGNKILAFDNVIKTEQGRWHSFAIEVPNDGSYIVKIYVDGVLYKKEFKDPIYGTRHLRIFPSCSTREGVEVYLDNIRSYQADSIIYNPHGDRHAVLEAVADDVSVFKTNILYDDPEASYTAEELVSKLTVDKKAEASIRVYSDSTFATELAPTDVVTNDSIVVVAAKNGYDMERAFTYYKINPPVNTTLFDISVIDEAAKTAKVTGFLKENITETDDLSAIAIPERIAGYTITEIGEKAFYKNTVIQSVVIPDTVTKIGNSAFGNTFENGTAFGNITSVVLSKNLKEIGESAFQCNGGLKEITFPEGLEKIGPSAFYWTGLKEITLPDSVTSIGSSAFRLCMSLNYLKLSAGVTSYTNQFYSNGLKLKELVIPETVTSIGDLALTDLTKYDMDPVVYGIAGTYAESYAEANGWEFVNIIANTLVTEAGIYGDGNKELAGTDYDIKYGFKTFDYKAKLSNVGSSDTTALVMIALYDTEGRMVQRFGKPIPIKASETVVIDEEDGISIPADGYKEGYTIKAFIWKESNNEPISGAKEFIFDASKKELHVLAIANSFCNDSFSYIRDIAKADGITLKMQNMYIGGARVTQHYKNMLTNAANYTPVINMNYGQTTITVDEALKSDKWDIVALQAATHGMNSNDYAFLDYATWKDNATGSASGTPNLTTGELFEYIRNYVDERAPGAKKIMHMSWGPCESESRRMYDGRFKNAEDASKALFEAQKAAYEYASSIYSDVDGQMVPTSYAVQYALDNFDYYQEHSGEITGEKYENPVPGEFSIYRDETCHLTNYGRILVGLTWYEYITGNDARENPYQNNILTAQQMADLKEAAHWANQQVVPLTGSAQ